MTKLRESLNQRLRQLIAESIAPCLKVAGFRKRGFRFTRRTPSCETSHVIEVQRSQYVASDETSFIVNAGVYIHKLAPVGFGVQEGGNIQEAICPLRIRPGDIEGVGQKWWDFTSTSGPDRFGEIAGELHQMVCVTMVNWLDQFQTWKDAADYLVAEEKGPGRTRIGYRDPVQSFDDCLSGAICYLLAGEPEMARKWSDLAVKAAVLPVAVERMTELRDRLHRLIDEGFQAPLPDTQ